MNKERIKHAAEEDSLWFAIKGNEDKESLYKEAFAKGAEWRINSVWHDNTEEPQIEGGMYLVSHHCGMDYLIGHHDYFCKPSYPSFSVPLEEVERWAYVGDLLPNKE